MTRRFRVLAPALACALVAVLAPAADAADPTVTITAPAGVFVATNSVDVGIDVTNGNGADVLIERRYAGQPDAQVCSGGNDVDHYHFTCEVFLYVNTTIVVLLDGQPSATRTLFVRPLIQTQLRTGYQVAGKYRVMAAGKEPKFVSASTPGIEGQMCLRHQVQRYRDGAWRTVVTTGCRTEQDKGRVTWIWRGSHPRNVSFRVRATFPGNAVNAAGPGRWLYFRFR